MGSGSSDCGFAAIRPPGHHASEEKACGFCMFNNVAVAARHAQKEYGLKNIAIVDWDVHHGNGTNDVFAKDKSVFFFSLHRYDDHFFPGTGFVEDVGKDQARGFNVNVPLEKGFGDLDMVHVFKHLICPLMDNFKPDAIFISAGFDAASNLLIHLSERQPQVISCDIILLCLRTLRLGVIDLENAECLPKDLVGQIPSPVVLMANSRHCISQLCFKDLQGLPNQTDFNSSFFLHACRLTSASKSKQV